MPYFGTQPAETALTTGDLGDNIVDGTKTKDALIADYSDVTITASDLLMYGDATDSNNTKRDTVQGVLDLMSAGFTAHSDGTKSVSSSSDNYTWTSIPSTATLIVINFFLIDLGQNDSPYIQIGDSGGLETSGYDGQSANRSGGNDQTDGFPIGTNDSSASYCGMMFLSLAESSTNTWVYSGTCGSGLSEKTMHYGGYKALSGTLDRVQFMCDSGDSFDNSTGRLLLMYI